MQFAAPILAGLGATSAGMSILGGIQAEKAGRSEAKRIGEAKRIDEVASAQRATELARNIRATSGAHRALAAARGFDIGDIGTPLSLEDAIFRRGARELQLAGLNRLARGREFDLQGFEAKQRGRAGLFAGLASGFGGLASTGLSLGLSLGSAKGRKT